MGLWLKVVDTKKGDNCRTMEDGVVVSGDDNKKEGCLGDSKHRGGTVFNFAGTSQLLDEAELRGTEVIDEEFETDGRAEADSELLGDGG